jgi:uncharacterized protein YqfB (UPF0267 family)
MGLHLLPRLRGRDLTRLIFGFFVGFFMLVEVAAALSVSPSSLQVAVGSSGKVAVSNTRGTVTASSSNTKVATVAYANGVATITGSSAGSTTVTIRDRSESRKQIAVTVVAASLTVSPTSVTVAAGSTAAVSVTNASGAVSVKSSNTAIATVTYASGVATIRGVAAGTATVTVSDSRSSRQVTATVTAVTPGLTVSPTTLTLTAGSTANVSVTNASGAVTASSSNTGIATVTYASGVATIRGVAAGTATITIADQKTSKQVTATVTAVSPGLTVSPTSVSVAVGSTSTVTVTNASGTVTASSSNTAIATVTYASGIATIRGVAAGNATVTIADSSNSKQVAVTVTATTTTGSYSLLAWNNLGMHCTDGVDYSIFSILPPFNVLNAQLVDKSAGKAVTSGVTLTYQAVADSSGSINTISSTKTNFWQYVQTLFPGFSPAPDVGLAGYPTPSNTPAAMTFSTTNTWFEAVGIPITPFDDSRNTNYYPMVQVTAKNTSGQVLATTKIVLPVSDEMSCVSCHASTNGTNAAAIAAKPQAGWVFDSNSVTDWKKNILRLHDEKQASNATYTAALAAKGLTGGLYTSAINGKPALCATCHTSNAFLVDAGLQTGVTGISPLTQAIHKRHSGVTDPATGMALDNTANRGSCYNCHPGATTQCLRGAMANVTDTSGNVAIQCQSCHGKMSNVAATTRSGWLSEPNCQACHHDGKREVSAVDASGNVLNWTDTRFATVANKPSAGYSLYRFSTGHGGMQCEACHGATHAEYPTTQPNDNVQSIALQGHAGTVHECTACHATAPTTTTGGPHGLHTIGQAWVSSHQSAAKAGTAACAVCHGANFRGTPLSEVKMAKSLTAESKTVSFTAGQAVGCYDCHNGPSGG